MTYWAEDPNLFLHKGKYGVVHVQRCKKETTLLSSSMLMKSEDFVDEGEVINHLSLYGGCYDWDKEKYEALIDYIYSNHFMVNCHGFVIVELATDDHRAAAPVVVSSSLLQRKKKAAATPVQLVYIRALDILDMEDYGLHPCRAVPSRSAKYLQDGRVIQTEPNLNEVKLTEELSIKSQELENFQQEMLTKEKTEMEVLTKRLSIKSQELENLQQEMLTKEKTEMEVLTKRVVALEAESTNNKNTGSTTEAPIPVFRIYTKFDTSYSLTIRNGEKVTFQPNDKSDVCQYWMKDDNYGARVKDVCGYPSYALVNKFTGQAMKPSRAQDNPVELVPYNPDVLDKSILWSEVHLGDGYRAIRKAIDPSLNLDASLETGKIGDETVVHVWTWFDRDNQKWNMVPYT